LQNVMAKTIETKS